MCSHYLDGFHHQVVVDATHGCVRSQILFFDSKESLSVKLLTLAEYVIIFLALPQLRQELGPPLPEEPAFDISLQF